MTVRDRELLDLLRDEPELLAVADAVEATQRVRRSGRYLTPVAGAAVAVAALVVLALVAPWRDDARNPILDRALAAVGRGPVVHVKERVFTGERVHIASGRVSRVATTRELWYDEERARARILVRQDGRTVRNALVLGVDAHQVRTFTTASLAAAARYRDALARGEARIVGEGVVRGRAVYWIRTDSHGSRLVIEVAVDRRTYQPVRFRALYDGRPTGYETETLLVETVERDEDDFRAPRLTDLGGAGHTSATFGGGPAGLPGWSPTAARSALGRTAFWAGRSVAGLRLGRIDVEDVSVTEHDRGDRRLEGDMLVVRYGDRLNPPQRPSVRGIMIREMRADDPARSLVAEPAPAGYVDIETYRIGSGVGSCEPKPCDPPGPDKPFEIELWRGALRRDGIWIEIHSTSRALLLEAARALTPIPASG